MRDIGRTYGHRTFEVWNATHPDDLRHTQTTPDEASNDTWTVTSFPDLVQYVAFVGSMNKRLSLIYRGQSGDWPLLPTLFRESWIPGWTSSAMSPRKAQAKAWDELIALGPRVHDLAAKLGLPRYRGLREIRESQWALIQHYELWPTPFIDLTTSLRVAASFAMDFKCGTSAKAIDGYVYVLGVPYLTGSITFDIDQHIVLARLQSCCPPIAKRPHFQEGFHITRFPCYGAVDLKEDKLNLRNRLIAKFRLIDAGSFWSADFPQMSRGSLLPERDDLLDIFRRELVENLLASAERIGAG